MYKVIFITLLSIALVACGGTSDEEVQERLNDATEEALKEQPTPTPTPSSNPADEKQLINYIINAAMDEDLTPYYELIENLLVSGVDPNATYYDDSFSKSLAAIYEGEVNEELFGYYPLHLAIETTGLTLPSNNYPGGIPSLLIEFGADPNLKTIPSPEGGSLSPLHFSIGNGLFDITESLLNKGARINEEDGGLNTPLDYIWVAETTLNSFELYGGSLSDLWFTQETLDSLKQMLLTQGAEHGTGGMSMLAQLESDNIYGQMGELMRQTADIFDIAAAGASTNIGGASSLFDPSLSPDGTKIAFSSDIDGQSGYNIYVMDIDGSNITRLTTNNDAYDQYPSWSPDGTKIAFYSGDSIFSSQIYTMNSDGTNQTRVP